MLVYRKRQRGKCEKNENRTGKRDEGKNSQEKKRGQKEYLKHEPGRGKNRQTR